MNVHDVAFLPATELVSALASGMISSRELVEIYLTRISDWNDKLSAFITVCSEEALAAARQADAQLAGGVSLGSLHGLPIAIKDQFFTKGVRTTCGSAKLKNFVPSYDATIVTLLKNQGAIVLGKLNMTEFALGAKVFPFGQPRNPWNTDHEAGASSAGSGIAVAAGLCGAAVGADTGGSIRTPASHNGIVGLRPSWGRVSRYGCWPVSWSMDTAGPMTRTVKDSALLLQIMSGKDSKDPFAAPLPVPNYPAELGRDLLGVKVGVIRETVFSTVVDPEVQATVLAAAHAFEGLGATVEEISIPLLSLAGLVFVALCDSEAATAHQSDLITQPEMYDRTTRCRMIAASLLPSSLHSKMQQTRSLIRDQVRAALDRFDVLLSPSAATVAPRIGDSAGTQSPEVLATFFAQRSYTSAFALAGTPAISIPCGFSISGLPIGLQLASSCFGELTLLQIAHTFEEATPWHNRRPSMAAKDPG